MERMEKSLSGGASQDRLQQMQPTFNELIEAVREGSQDAAWQLTERYSPHILRVVRWSLPKAIRPKVDSQDLLQSVWATLLLEPGKLHGLENQNQFMGYIAGIARNKVIDKHRHFTTKKKDVRIEASELDLREDSQRPLGLPPAFESNLFNSEPSPSHAVMVREQWQRVLDRGSTRDHEIIELRLKGRSYSEIAEQLEIDERTVQRSVSRMVAEFKK